MKVRDLTEQRFGRLVAIDRAAAVKPSGKKFSLWRCRCDCGKETSVPMGDLVTGNTTSCGCRHVEVAGARFRTHGKSKTSAAYGVWTSMRKRCSNPKDRSYPNYGGRGITVCERWDSFERFLDDMGEPPIGAEIERKDNDGSYRKDNCVWATRAEQARNRRTNILITIGGETMCLLDWCRHFAMPYSTVRARISRLGWPAERALTTAVGAK